MCGAFGSVEGCVEVFCKGAATWEAMGYLQCVKKNPGLALLPNRTGHNSGLPNELWDRGAVTIYIEENEFIAVTFFIKILVFHQPVQSHFSVLFSEESSYIHSVT